MAEPDNDQEAVKMEAEHLPGRMEEKDVLYRKNKPSSNEVEPSINDESHEDDYSGSADMSTKIRAQQTEIKRIFCDYMDALATVEIDEVFFTWTKPGSVTFNVTASK